jgi:hypothetical protein
MENRGALLKSGVLAAAVAVACAALWVGRTPAQEALSAESTDTSLTSSTSTNAIQRPWNTSLVSVSGTVTGSPESVKFSGTAKVGTRLAPDPHFGSPSLIVSVDLSPVSGVGSSTRAKYVIGGPEIVQKRLAPSYNVDLTFPFYKSGTDGTTGARSGAATFSFTVDGSTGAVNSPQGIIVSSSL